MTTFITVEEAIKQTIDYQNNESSINLTSESYVYLSEAVTHFFKVWEALAGDELNTESANESDKATVKFVADQVRGANKEYPMLENYTLRDDGKSKVKQDFTFAIHGERLTQKDFLNMAYRCAFIMAARSGIVNKKRNPYKLNSSTATYHKDFIEFVASGKLDDYSNDERQSRRIFDEKMSSDWKKSKVNKSKDKPEKGTRIVYKRDGIKYENNQNLVDALPEIPGGKLVEEDFSHLRADGTPSESSAADDKTKKVHTVFCSADESHMDNANVMLGIKTVMSKAQFESWDADLPDDVENIEVGEKRIIAFKNPMNCIKCNAPLKVEEKREEVDTKK